MQISIYVCVFNPAVVYHETYVIKITLYDAKFIHEECEAIKICLQITLLII